jgi:tetratricopeptide (TPR) repeat protein
MTEETLFRDALALPPSERATFLARACAGLPDLHDAVTARLVAHESAGGTTDRATPGPERTGQHTPEPDVTPRAGADPYGTTDFLPVIEPGAIIAGRYVLTERIGEGGMGEVWVAEQFEPVKRRVALKLIKAGMDSRDVLTRFGVERQIIALMDHPHIARIHDGGLTFERRPFFVMELVKGLPLTHFCDAKRLTTRQRLELFVPICQAVQHAHQKGIIHRDLKPSNVLVTLLDGRPVPKVIDFGLAKATGGKVTDETFATQFGAVVGTLEYMAPEQADPSGLDVDTRADVYSLGVILYELLTGLRPIDARRLKKVSVTEMIRLIQEEEPARPSVRLSTEESLPALAALRQTEPRKLTALLRGELDWVVMKCLEKDRGRRYETADALARDVQRYLADEPVEARPPSFGYRTGKQLRRNKGAVLAAALVLLALVGGVIGTTWKLYGEARQRALAEEARDGEARQRELAERARDDEKKARATAEAEKKQAEAAAELLESVFRAIDPRNEQAGAPGLKEQLVARFDGAALKLDAEYAGEPLVRARLRHVLGVTQMGLGESARAEALLRAALDDRRALLGPDNIDTLATLGSLAVVVRRAGRIDEAITLFEEARDLQMRTLGPEHRDTLANLNGLALAYRDAARIPDAVRVFEQVRDAQLKQFGPDSPVTLVTLNNLGLAYRSAGRIDEAVRLFEQVYDQKVKALGATHLSTLATLTNLVLAYQDAGLPADAIRRLEEVRDQQTAKLSADHPQTLQTLHNLGNAYAANGRTADAIALLEQVRALRTKKLGADQLDTLSTLHSLAVVYRVVGRTDEAIALFERVRAQRTKQLTANHPLTLVTLNSLGLAYLDAGRTADAMKLFEQVRDQMAARFPADHPHNLQTRHNLGLALRAAGRTAEAVELLEQVREQRANKLGRDHPDTIDTLGHLALAYQDAGKLPQAAALFEQVRDWRAKRKKLEEAKAGSMP